MDVLLSETIKKMGVKKRKFEKTSDDHDADDVVYKFNVLLPNGISVPITRRNPVTDSLSVQTFVEKVKDKCSVILRQTEGSKSRRKVLWNSKALYLEDSRGNKLRSKICFDKFKPYKTHFVKLFDGAGQAVDTFENMWDLTPDTDLLTELPDDYTFETALADLIDNSLQAVWSNGKGERKLISIEIDEAEVSVSDTGPGMDGSDENSIVKWGKMGASVHRSSKKLAIGGSPPYLTPFFGMFGYGGTIASMHLGRHAVVSAKTKESTEVYWLRLERDALLKQSGSDLSWKAAGGIRGPTDSEIEMSPHGSFTKIVMKPKLKLPDIFQLQCRLKDIYFPYIQCDEISKTGRTTTLVEFQINGINLAEVEGGEVAVTNLHSCNGPNFVLNLHLSIEEDKAGSKSSSVRAVRGGNARLKCVYFPIIEGKESIERILEKLNADGFDIKEDYETFSRISIRRLGRLLPEARWELLPFMKLKQKRGAKVQILKRCYSRVKCFIDTDAGFNPIPSKTDLAPHHPFTKALKDLGGDAHQKEKVVNIQISRGEKRLTLQQLEKEYHNWIFQMHNQYDDECSLGDDEPIWLTSVPNKEALGVTSDVLRVHEVISRKGKTWSRGQKVKILKGACAGCHKSNIFATLEYFLLEGLEKDAGGEARIVCRPLGVVDEDGSVLAVDAASTSLELHSSISLPIIVIDSGKCFAVSDDEWNCQANKLYMKLPSMIEVLGPQLSKALDIDGALPTDASVSAGSLPPKEIAAVLRPSKFSPSSNAADIDQKYIIRDNYEMCLDIKFQAEAGKGSKMDQIFSGTAINSSRKGCSGLYIFSVSSIPSLFQKAGAYSFSFFLKNSATTSCEKIVRVKASAKIKRWEFSKDDGNSPLSVSCFCSCIYGAITLPKCGGQGSSFPSFSVTRYDEYGNIIPFKSIPEIEVQLLSNGVILSYIKNVKVELSLNMDCMKFSNVRIATDKLDNIRPNYEATLALSQPDKRPFLSIPCFVFPGPIRFVHVHSSDTGKGLLPKQVVDDIRLEILDRHQNHVKEGTEVELEIHGFCFLDQIGLKRKVDNDGFLDLSGLLKVTEGYGKPVNLSVKSNKTVLCNKKFQVEKRELRMASNVPEFCHAGSKLKDIAFEVVNSEGHIDHAIHDDVRHGNEHTLRVLTDVPGCDSLSCAFRQGRCVIPFITLPKQEGTFCVEAVHSQHPELRLKFEVNVSRSLHTEYDTTSDLRSSEEEVIRLGSGLQDLESVSGDLKEQDDDVSQPLDDRFTPLSVSDSAKHVNTGEGFDPQNSEVNIPQYQNECSFISPLRTINMEQGISTPPSSIGKFMLTSGNVCALTDSKLPKQQGTRAETPNKLSDPSNEHDLFKSPEGKITLLGSDLWDLDSEIESVEKQILDYGSRIKEHEDELKWSALHRNEIYEGLTQLQASIEVLPLPISQLDFAFQKEVVLENIENKVESPAAVYSIASQKMPLEIQYPEFSADVVGLVASLATAPTSLLSRSLAEYLGEDQMLGIVCKSSAAITMPENYENVLSSLASKLGRTIRGSQLIICLEDISITDREFDGDILETDCQRRLALPNPALPNGTTPPGFLGYAVNMIDIDANYVQFRTLTGHGLRETLFYQLLGELQVYETKDDMKHARGCITTGAISLDGKIIRRKGMILLGSEQVDVHFPVVEPSVREQVAREIEEKKEELIILEQAIACANEERQRCLKAFREKEARARKLLEEKEETQKLVFSQQSSKTTLALTQNP